MTSSVGKRPLTVFFAWQNDLPAKFNRAAIRKCLRIAAAEIEATRASKEPDARGIEIDEATRGLPGSPNIPAAIIQKIQGCDIFVGDLSIINSNLPDDSKRTPNPNVVFELGVAVAEQGWDRIIMLVNEVHGLIRSLPFDFDRQRASGFKLAENVGSEKELIALLRIALELIIEKEPARPKADRFDVQEAQRQRDLANIRLLLTSIHWPTIDEHILRGAKILTVVSTILFEMADEIRCSSQFHLYDPELRQAVDTFVDHWRDSMKYDHYMASSKNPNWYIFVTGHPGSRITQKEFDYMDHERFELRNAADVFLSLIRSRYPEIDIQAASQAAGEDYVRREVEIEKSFSLKKGSHRRGRKRASLGLSPPPPGREQD